MSFHILYPDSHFLQNIGYFHVMRHNKMYDISSNPCLLVWYQSKPTKLVLRYELQCSINIGRQVEGTVLNLSYSLSFFVGPLFQGKKL